MICALSISWDSSSEDPEDIVSLNTIKAQLRISHDEFDELITEVHLPGAVSWAEGLMHRSILIPVSSWK